MYQYIYDSFLADSKYARTMAMIENRLTDLGLQGRIERLTLFKDPRELIAAGIKRGVGTVVTVGNDITLNQIINAVAVDGLNVTVGFIPVGPKNEIAKILGIEEGVASCDCLSNRLIKVIDLGKINDRYFLSSLRTSSGEINMRCGEKYCIKLVNVNLIKIHNLPALGEAANPEDGYLETRIKPINKDFFKNLIFGIGIKHSLWKQESFFPIKKIFLESKKEFPIFFDGLKMTGTSAEIQILPKKLKMIVGKNRLF